MLKIVLVFVSTIVVCFGGYFGYQEFVGAKSEKVESVQEDKQNVIEVKVVNLEKEKVQDILKTNLDAIFSVFEKAGETNGWGNTNPADFSKIRPEVLSFATEEFADTTLKNLSADFYCECDRSFKANYSNDVRFSFEQTKDSILKIKALEPATELNNMGELWEFELNKEDDSWKINKWNNQSLSGQNIQLTKNEAEKLLISETEKPGFVKEYESKEAAGKAYLFNMQSSNGERLVAISSKDTSLVYDFGDNTKESVEQTNEESTQPGIEPTNQLEDEKDEPNLNASTKEEFLAKLTQTETKERKNEYQSDYQMRDDYGFNYQLWDGVLNEIYAVLKTQLSKSEMSNLRNEQLKWIETRDTTAQARYDEEGGGSMSAMVKVGTLFNLTKERCYELVNEYMK